MVAEPIVMWGCEIGSTSTTLTDPNRFTIGLSPDDVGGTSQVYGVHVLNQENARVHDCDISNLSTSGSSSNVYAIMVNGVCGITEVNGNRIYNLRNTSGDVNCNGNLIGLYLNPNTTSGYETRCYNNTISGFSHPRTSETSTYCIYGIYHAAVSSIAITTASRSIQPLLVPRMRIYFPVVEHLLFGIAYYPIALPPKPAHITL